MSLIFIGGTATLSAGGTGEIKLTPVKDVTLWEFMVYSTGRCEITDIEMVGVANLLDGVMELDNLKKYGNVFPLPKPIDWKKGVTLRFALKDISGATNTVYICCKVE